ncbi:MAG TPA: nucleotide disphospho-sugar-binding domain-containing protein [Thermoanaerobaculia bacterium]|nr:nucleotide disphospho-sugar-binding domain-containing protein [Thermoanaerobaculia bacterium]
MRALFCSFESPGFLFPAIGLAAALRARGHQVAFVADRTAEPRLRQAGFERLPRGDRDGRSFETGQWFRPLAVTLQVKHVEHAVARFVPDLLVGQALALGPLIVRERCGIPVAVQGLATYLWPCGAGRPGDAATATVRRRAWRHQTMLRHLNEARVLAGLPAADAGPGDSPLLGDLFQLRSVRELHGGDDLPSRTRLAGACLWEPENQDDELDAWIAAARDAGRPIVYVHHGRACGGLAFWQSLLEAFDDGALRIAAATSRPSAELEARLPPGAFYLRRQIEQGRVLRCADLLIGSAASSAVLGALSHGVACLLIPAGGEQLDLAEQVERAGAGRILAPKAVTPAALRRAASQVLADGRLRRGARELQRAFGKLAGFGAAAEQLEGLARPSRVRAAG